MSKMKPLHDFATNFSHEDRSRMTDRVPVHAHTTHSATGASLSPGHVFGTVFRPTFATRTLHTTVSDVNSKKRFCFNIASEVQRDLC